MNAAQRANAAEIANLLDNDDVVWELVADTIADSESRGTDAGQVVEDVIAALRNAT